MTPVGRDFDDLPRNVYRATSKGRRKYERIDELSLPKNIVWGPESAQACRRIAWTISKPGAMYKRIRDKHTGRCIYYRLITDWSPLQKKDAIDTEPKPPRTRYDVGSFCWFVGFNTRWYLVRVLSRIGMKMKIAPVTRLDADKICEWPYEAELEFTAKRNNGFYTRLRPLRARNP
jgi:hypothetical protein